MLWTRLTSHDSMAPYFPVPWSLGTSLSAFAQTPLPNPHAPYGVAQYAKPPIAIWYGPHAPTHPNTPFSAPPSPCSSPLLLGANSASTPPSTLLLAPGRLTEARVASTSSGTAKTSVRLKQKNKGTNACRPLRRISRRPVHTVATTARERVLLALFADGVEEDVHGRDGVAVAAGSISLQGSLNIAGPSHGNADSACGSVDGVGSFGSSGAEAGRALIAGLARGFVS